MPGIVELATVMMSGAQRRFEVTAANLGNISTPSYRSSRVFAQVLDIREGMPVDIVRHSQQASSNALKSTENPFDVATDGDAMLLFRVGTEYRMKTSGQLSRDADGQLVDASGGVLQASGGGDVVIGAGQPTILRDGTMLIDDQAVARVGLFRPTDETGMVRDLPQPMENGVLYQGFLAPSDVDTAAEMIELTKASRLAETGARVFQIYDELLGRAVTKLGDLGR